MFVRTLRLPLAIAALSASLTCSAQLQATKTGVEFRSGTDAVAIDFVEDNVAHIHVLPAGKADERTPVMDPAYRASAVSPSVRLSSQHLATLATTAVSVRVEDGDFLKVTLCDNATHCVQLDNLLAAAKGEALPMNLDHVQTLYGMRGLPLVDAGTSFARNGGATIAASFQGDGGAPLFFTDSLGVLIDSNGGNFQVVGPSVRFSGGSRKDLEMYVAFGKPMQVMSSMMKLTGLPPMAPKWTLGFIHSLWGTDEARLKEIAKTYREKQIPLDAFILDFDWKAWGEDNYGEWRWNSTHGKGAFAPDKFPDGASGAFAKELGSEGIKLAGILKPRILLSPDTNPDHRTEAAAYADKHNLWFPDEKPEKDYVTERMARNLNFTLPETRTWFWEHLRPSYQAGLVGWWNDEADPQTPSQAANVQFLNMGRTLYDGQRATDDRRVWSINRNYYLGANRYGYGLWSGDVLTGFDSMAYQERRMIASLNIGASHWSMDTGGFRGTPTPENYARWMEFAAWVPIFRVHGNFNEKRMPWSYGPVAEAAATKAIRTRYSLMPYMYSYEHADHSTGIGIVRPMFWIYPEDAEASALETEWMFGDAFLVSPVVTPGATNQRVYLPQGTWFDYSSGKRIEGKRWIDVAIDPKTWSDTPVFVRDGSIIATQEPQQFTDQHPVQEVTLDVFPNAQAAAFTYYEDDGQSYQYEKQQFLSQQISAQKSGTVTTLHLLAAEGQFKPALQHYILRVHTRAHAVSLNGKPLSESDSGWKATSDKYGDVAVLRVQAGAKLDITLR
ncbi:TIM-barrel domain-containing protein [Granulicella cerasi]|uniref:TIM-barrel domain-containing protein n=1 Tax=Granulicella cerasi TaxID=741063 RepID=A0ABW1Z5E8_9BACT|nr:TIM-barrel domain-containing protein [Granulicella cerasi]